MGRVASRAPSGPYYPAAGTRAEGAYLLAGRVAAAASTGAADAAGATGAGAAAAGATAQVL